MDNHRLGMFIWFTSWSAQQIVGLFILLLCHLLIQFRFYIPNPFKTLVLHSDNLLCSTIQKAIHVWKPIKISKQKETHLTRINSSSGRSGRLDSSVIVFIVLPNWKMFNLPRFGIEPKMTDTVKSTLNHTESQEFAEKISLKKRPTHNTMNSQRKFL